MPLTPPRVHAYACVPSPLPPPLAMLISALRLRAALEKVDPSQIAERERKAAFSSGVTGLPPDRHTGEDYPALREARANAAVAMKAAAGGDGDRRGEARGDSEDDSSDSDDDLDYLLDDPGLDLKSAPRFFAAA